MFYILCNNFELKGFINMSPTRLGTWEAWSKIKNITCLCTNDWIHANYFYTSHIYSYFLFCTSNLLYTHAVYLYCSVEMGFVSFGIWRRVYWYIVIDVYKEHASSIVRRLFYTPYYKAPCHKRKIFICTDMKDTYLTYCGMIASDAMDMEGNADDINILWRQIYW
jgi:hypothetical protein